VFFVVCFLNLIVQDGPIHEELTMEKSDSRRLRRMEEGVMELRQQFAFKSFLKALGRAAVDRMHWMALGLLITVGLFSFWNTFALINNNRSQVQLRTLLNEVQETLALLDDAETGQRGYLLLDEDAYLEPYTRAIAIADQQLAKVGKLISAIPSEQFKFQELRNLIETRYSIMKNSIDLRKSQGIDAAMQVVRTGKGKRVMDEIRVMASELKLEIQTLLSKGDVRTVAFAKRATIWAVLGTVLAAVLFVAVIQRERRDRKRAEQRAMVDEGTEELARSVETSRLLALAKSEREIEALGQQARDLAAFVQTLQERTLKESDKEIEALGLKARDLARSVEATRIQTLMQTEGKIEALGKKARELASTVETSRILTLNQSDVKIEELGQLARDLASSVESSRLETLIESDGKIKAMGEEARELAFSVETSRLETLIESDGKIKELGKTARDLATSMETSRIRTLNQSDGKIEALGQRARDLATFVETSRIQALNESNQEIRKLNEELEERVLERTAQLEAANKELDSFSYSVSHDLRAPLRAIDGFSRIVMEDHSATLSEEGRSYLQMVRDNTRQMGQLVDDLLAFARLGRQPLAKHLVEPDKMVRQCLTELTKEQEGRQLELVIGELPCCHGDPALLKQVWTNLISNALKYTRKKDKARIEIGCRTEAHVRVEGEPHSRANAGPEVIYFVKDNGAGFDMKYIKKLFGVFQRLHKVSDYEGTGVGLAIVQRIVNRHGGRIWADAKFNEGATFSFTLA
jgi:signal transduction histidine kinase/CHASE3 domain sensor protein